MAHREVDARRGPCLHTDRRRASEMPLTVPTFLSLMGYYNMDTDMDMDMG